MTAARKHSPGSDPDIGHGTSVPTARPARGRRLLGVLLAFLLAGGIVWWVIDRESGTVSAACPQPTLLEYDSRTYQRWPTVRGPELGQSVGTGVRFPCGHTAAEAGADGGVEIVLHEMRGVPPKVAVLAESSERDVVYLNVERLDQRPVLPSRARNLQQPLDCRVIGNAEVTGVLTQIQGRSVEPTEHPTPATPTASASDGRAQPTESPSRPLDPDVALPPELPYGITVEVGGAGLGAPEYTWVELPVRITEDTAGGQDRELLTAALPTPGERQQQRLRVTLHCVGGKHYADRIELL